MKGKVIVTGATGFLGSNLAKRLVKLGYDVYGLGRNFEKGRLLEESGINFVQTDLNEIDKLEEIFEGTDYVFHCAAKSSLWGKYEDFYNSNVLATQNIVKLSQKYNIKRLIYVSSPSVYFEFKDKFDIKESDKITTKYANHYIKTKVLSEKVVDDAHIDGLDVITIRPRGIFGVGDNAIVPRLIRLSQHKYMPKTVKEDILIDITHVDNVVESLILCMNAPKNCSGQKYNITNGEHIYFYETMQYLMKELKIELKFKQISYKKLLSIASILEFFHKITSYREPIITKYTVGLLTFNQTLDITKAKEELGYKPIISVKDGLKDMIKTLNEDSNG